MNKRGKKPEGEAKILPAPNRIIGVLKYLKENTDEYNTVTQTEMRTALQKDGNYGKNVSFSTMIDEILTALNPADYSKDNDDQFKIKYKDYENDFMVKRKEIEEKLKNKEDILDDEYKIVPPIKDLYFSHDFSYNELDSIINAISCSKMISEDEKVNLLTKLAGLNSNEYKKRWVNDNGKLKFDAFRGIEDNIRTSNSLNQNIQLIFQAINSQKKITFLFNTYEYAGDNYGRAILKLSPLESDKKTIKYYKVTPYYVMAYNGRNYIVCCDDYHTEAALYRIDLMTEISILDEKGKPIKDVGGVPSSTNQITTSQFISEHLNMFYGKIEDCQLKIRNDRYTVLHDWFGDNFKRLYQFNENYDVVRVRCSSKALVYWAMQYCDIVEVLSPDSVRNEISDKLLKMYGMYGRQEKKQENQI